MYLNLCNVTQHLASYYLKSTVHPLIISKDNGTNPPIYLLIIGSSDNGWTRFRYVRCTVWVLALLYISIIVEATGPDSCDAASTCAPVTIPPSVIPEATTTITTSTTTVTSSLKTNQDSFLNNDGANIVSLLTAAMVAVMLLIQVICMHCLIHDVSTRRGP